MAGTGLLPVAAARYARARDVRPWAMIRRAAGVTGAGLLLLGGGHAAGLAGLLPEYRPPRLAASEYAGTWTGDGGARLVLHRDGTMSAEALPVVARDGGIDRCTGDGTWSFDPEAVPANRDGCGSTSGPVRDPYPPGGSRARPSGPSCSRDCTARTPTC
ncbi:hypothetical protein [Streptomyces sp. NPDC058623]|uniref:hypothetical protein n=1 Tax=Streptomyces sp. NPDC058623 TaxID=3346563 RepID=UPI003666F0BD